jgi:hypothetical protein
VVAHDPEAFPAAALAARLARDLPPGDDILRWRLQPIAGGGYYTSKNSAAARSGSDIVVFLDSDVVPEPEWLARLVGALETEGVEVVAGNTYIEPVGVIGKTFAVTWFFPLRSDDGPLYRTSEMFANNLAMRRELFVRHPFPTIPGTSRGACLLLARQLAQAGIAVVLDPGARAAHPAPNGFAHISLRALAQGRDRVLRERSTGGGLAATWLASCYRLCRHAAGSTWKIVVGCHRVGLGPPAIPAAITVAFYYYLLYWLGETLLQLRIPAVRRIRI